jgi:feruloyl-CoA synthase
MVREDEVTRPYRKVRLGALAPVLERRADGTLLLRDRQTLPPYPERLTDSLIHWAEATPERLFMARRVAGGDWRRLDYATTLALVRRLGQALLERDLSPERPIAILSGNDLEHALLALAAQHVGIPYSPISPAYSLVSRDFTKLRHILARLTPGMVFVANGEAFGPALDACMPNGAELVAGSPARGRPATSFKGLLETPPTAAVERAHAATGPDSVAKLLFTSGSTGQPKAVINTQRMICSNQTMLRCVLAFLQDAPPVLVDWLPWNHTFGGNHNTGHTLVTGGSLYLDDGRPTSAGITETVRNLREVAPTVYFNVPKGYAELIPYLRAEPELRKTFFSRLKLLFFAGAGLPAHDWEALDELAQDTVGERILMLTGLGATESAPFALSCDASNTGSGRVGLPVPGVELKLVPVEGKLEARLSGPSITPGYWREPEITEAAFDEEGFYKLGDAVRFVDPEDLGQGLAFDGRIAEDFKLSSGTWISTGPLRARVITELAPLVRDVVIAAPDRPALGALVIPDLDACRKLAGVSGGDAAAVLAAPPVRTAFEEGLARLAAAATGNSNRITRLILLHEALSIDAHEVTDKGSVNQRAVLGHRAELVDELYRAGSPRVIALEEEIG